MVPTFVRNCLKLVPTNYYYVCSKILSNFFRLSSAIFSNINLYFCIFFFSKQLKEERVREDGSRADQHSSSDRSQRRLSDLLNRSGLQPRHRLQRRVQRPLHQDG